jgi:hypothetical protein
VKGSSVMVALGLGFGARGLAFWEVRGRRVYFVVILVWESVSDGANEEVDWRPTVVGRAFSRRVDCSSHD